MSQENVFLKKSFVSTKRSTDKNTLKTLYLLLLYRYFIITNLKVSSFHIKCLYVYFTNIHTIHYQYITTVKKICYELILIICALLLFIPLKQIILLLARNMKNYSVNEYKIIKSINYQFQYPVSASYERQ